MSSPEPSARPSQVTVAGWTVAVTSVLLVAGVFDAMGNLHSVDTREQITRSLTSGSAKGLGLSVDDAIEVMRWALFVSGAAAAAAAILGIYVLQRNKGARIALTVAAVPIVLVAPLSQSFLGMFVGAATAILWTRPARDWFAGRPPNPAERAPDGPAVEQPPASPAPTATPWLPPAPSSPGAEQPPPMPGWGAPQTTTPYPGPYGYQHPAPPPPGPAAPRPRQIRTACLLTWIFSALTALGYIAVLAVVAVDSDLVMDALKKNADWDPSYSDDLILTGIVGMSVLFLLWSVTAAVLAVFVWRRTYWAWVLLSITVGIAGLASVIALPFSLAHLVAAGVATGMLLSKPSRAWFAGR